MSPFDRMIVLTGMNIQEIMFVMHTNEKLSNIEEFDRMIVLCFVNNEKARLLWLSFMLVLALFHHHQSQQWLGLMP